MGRRGEEPEFSLNVFTFRENIRKWQNIKWKNIIIFFMISFDWLPRRGVSWDQAVRGWLEEMLEDSAVCNRYVHFKSKRIKFYPFSIHSGNRIIFSVCYLLIKSFYYFYIFIKSYLPPPICVNSLRSRSAPATPPPPSPPSPYREYHNLNIDNEIRL